MYENSESRGEIQNFESMTKNGHEKFWRMKIEKYFWEKVKLGKFSTESEKFVEIGGKSETGGKRIIASGDGRLCFPVFSWCYVKCFDMHLSHASFTKVHALKI